MGGRTRREILIALCTRTEMDAVPSDASIVINCMRRTDIKLLLKYDKVQLL